VKPQTLIGYRIR